MQHYWRTRGAFSPEAWFLNLMVELDGRPIGAQHVRSGGVRRPFGRSTPGHGWGERTRAVASARRCAPRCSGSPSTGSAREVAETSAFLDNHASNGVSRALGYEENGLGSLAPEGVARVTQKFRMTAEGWRSRPRPALAIDGLDGIRDMFGAASADRA